MNFTIYLSQFDSNFSYWIGGDLCVGDTITIVNDTGSWKRIYKQWVSDNTINSENTTETSYNGWALKNGESQLLYVVQTAYGTPNGGLYIDGENKGIHFYIVTEVTHYMYRAFKDTDGNVIHSQMSETISKGTYNATSYSVSVTGYTLQSYSPASYTVSNDTRSIVFTYIYKKSKILTFNGTDVDKITLNGSSVTTVIINGTTVT